MNKGAFDAGKGAIFERLPRDIVRHRNQFGAERAHPIDLRLRRGFDRDDGAGHAGFSRGVGDALPGVARADRPDTARPLGFGQHRDGVGRAAQFVGVDRLEIFELQPDVGKIRAEFQPDEWRAKNRWRRSAALPRGCRSSVIARTGGRMLVHAGFIDFAGLHRFENLEVVGSEIKKSV